MDATAALDAAIDTVIAAVPHALDVSVNRGAMSMVRGLGSGERSFYWQVGITVGRRDAKYRRIHGSSVQTGMGDTIEEAVRKAIQAVKFYETGTI